MTTRPLTIVIAAMGGQGGGVLADWIVDIAEHGGYLAQATSVPGVAQRTGATIYTIELFPEADAKAAGRDPVLTLMPFPGEVDIVIASEIMEAGRAMQRGFITPARTVVIASSHREYAISEKSAIGDGIADHARVTELVRQGAKQFICFDMAGLAESSGSVISAVLLGALAGVGTLPFRREDYAEGIRRSGLAVERNLAGFAAGYDRALAGEEKRLEQAVTSETPTASRPEGQALLQHIRKTFPSSAQTMIIEGVKRLVDYQDLAYAHLYLNRLESIRALDKGDPLLTREVARYLALWMSYEDAIRIADLKTRSDRFQRFRNEVGVTPDQLVYVVEFLHPRLQEICDILPAALGRSVLNSRFLQDILGACFRKGRQVSTAKLSGFLTLYVLAGLRPWRRISYRFHKENTLIENWLGRITDAARDHYELAVEIAKCQRLIKGYGDTHERGMRNFNTILAAADRIGSGDHAASSIRDLREAALADDTGAALDADLRRLMRT